MHPFFAGVLICTVFAPPKKQKRAPHGFQTKNDENWHRPFFVKFLVQKRTPTVDKVEQEQFFIKPLKTPNKQYLELCQI